MKFQKLMWFGCGMLVGMMALSVSFAALTPTPTVAPTQITDDTALYQKMSEIKAHKESNPTFDTDIDKLSKSEGRYRENLPILATSPRLRTPMERIAKTKYRYVPKKTAETSSNQ
jgi:hypothetical protein